MLGGLDYRSIAVAVKRAFSALGLPITGSDGYPIVSLSGAFASLPPALGYNLVGGYLDWTVAGNVLTCAVKTWAGNDPSAAEPVWYAVRDVTPATGTLTYRKLTAALSVTVNNTALVGTINNIAFHLWGVIFNDGGTDRLAIINCLQTATTLPNIYPLAGFAIASATLSDNAADNAHVFYANAAIASKACTTVGYASWEAGLAAAGTWSAGPTRKQLYGPGVPLPGTKIQQQVSTDATGRSTTSTTFQSTNCAVTITPNSSANLIELEGSTTGGWISTNNSVGGTSEYQIARGTATGTSLGTRRVGYTANGVASTTWEVVAPVHIKTFDVGQAGATTYTLAYRTTGALDTAAAQKTNTSGILIASEVMT